MLTDDEWKKVQEMAPVGNTNQAVAKLTQVQRREAFALVKMGFSHNLVAQLFHVNKSTIGHMVRPTSKHYVDIRNEYQMYGHEDFLRRFLTFNTMDQAKGLKAKIEQDLNSREAKLDKKDHHADKRAGSHKHDGIDFNVIWVNLKPGDDRYRGWLAVRDVDKDDPFPADLDYVCNTSSECYDRARKDIEAYGTLMSC